MPKGNWGQWIADLIAHMASGCLVCFVYKLHMSHKRTYSKDAMKRNEKKTKMKLRGKGKAAARAS